MLSCPKCNGTQVKETTRQVRVMRPDIAQTLRRSLKFIFIGIIAATAILAVIVNSIAPANSDAVGRYLAMGVSLVVFVGVLVLYAKNNVIRTMHVYTCVACRKTWYQIAQDNS
jgi:hypothetical protein